MVRNYKKISSRGNWDKNNMANALAEVRAGRLTCLAAANTFSIPEATLRRRLKKNDDEMPVHGGRFRQVFSAEQQQELNEYLTAMDQSFFGMTTLQCRRLVFEYAEKLKIPHPFNKEARMAGEDWLNSFMTRFNFSLRKPEATSIARGMGFNKPSVDKFFEILKEVRGKYKFPASAIYNADESGLSSVPNKLPKVISPAGTRRVSKIVSAERGRNVTIICCISACGYYLPPFLIFGRKRMRPDLVERAPPGTVGHCSDNGWSNGEIFVEFLKHFHRHVKPNAENPVLLLVDNHKTHITLDAINFCREEHIVMVGFPTHTTHRLQPLDVSFFGPLKTYFSQACDNFMVNHPGEAINDNRIGELLSAAYLKAATVGNAVNGFKKCGIEPYDPLVFSDHDFAASRATEQSFEPSPTNSENAPSMPTRADTFNETFPEEHEQGTDKETDLAGTSAVVSQTIFDMKPLPVMRQGVRKRKNRKQSASIITSTPVKLMLTQREDHKAENERAKRARMEARAVKKPVARKLDLGSSKVSKKPLPKINTSASTSKEPEIRCPACEEIYFDPPVEDWIQCLKCHVWWHEACSNFDGGKFICDYC